MSTIGAGEGAVLYPPKEAARRLGVTTSGLRRLAGIYADLYGPLPRDESEQGDHERKTRLWPEEALERLEAARALVDTNRYSSIKDALEALERGVTAPDTQEVALPPVAELRRHIEALATLPAQVDNLTQAQTQAFALLQSLAATAERLTTAVEGLQEQNRVLDEQNRVLHEEIMALAPSKEDTKAAYVEEMEEVHADLERRNRYLMGELDRRDAEAVKVSKPWWRLWR